MVCHRLAQCFESCLQLVLQGSFIWCGSLFTRGTKHCREDIFSPGLPRHASCAFPAGTREWFRGPELLGPLDVGVRHVRNRLPLALRNRTRVLPSVISMTALLLRAAGVREERTAWRSRVRTLPQCSSEDCCSCSFHSRFGWKLSWRFSRVRTRDWARAGSTACCDSRQSASRCPVSLNLGGARACGTNSFAVESLFTS